MNAAEHRKATRIVDAIRAELPTLDHLRRKPFRGHPNPYVDHCYISMEAFCHLTGAKPQVIRHEGDTHWYALLDGEVFDPTADQFATPVDYSAGRGCGLQGKPGVPSRRTRELLARLA